MAPMEVADLTAARLFVRTRVGLTRKGCAVTEEELIGRYIELNPNKPWLSEAWLKGSGIPIWAMIGAFRGVDHDRARLAELYGVSIEAVRAVLAYYDRHRCEIDARLAENEAAVDWPYATAGG